MGRRRDPQVDPTTKPPSGYLESPLQCAIFALNRKRQGQQQQKILHCTTQERTSTTALSTFPYRSMKSRQTVLPRHHTSSVNGCPARFALEFDACRAYRAKCKRGISHLGCMLNRALLYPPPSLMSTQQPQDLTLERH